MWTLGFVWWTIPLTMTTHAALARHLARTHQPVSYVAECTKIPPPKLARFATNEGPLTAKETERLDAFLTPRSPRWRGWAIKGTAIAAGIAGTACTTTVQEWVRNLIKHLTE